MIVRCPECKREYNLELNDAVVELNFTCSNCGLEFKVRNTGMTDVEKHNEKYAPRPMTAPIAANAIQEPNTQEEYLSNSVEEGSLSRLKAAVIIMGVVFAISLAIWIYVNVRT